MDNPQLISILRCLVACFFLVFMAACRADAAPVPSPMIESEIDLITKDWWTPKPGQIFQVQFEGDIDLNIAVDVMILDLYETSTADVASLHNRDVKVSCYLNAGAWEAWRPDRDDFPESVVGFNYYGWPGERWLDIRQLDVLQPILEARLDLCLEKGFDGVEPDNLDGYQNATGFSITADDQLKFNRWLAQAAHERGLAIGLKNNPDQAHILVNEFDWITTENCFKQDWCEQASVFIQAGKPVFAIEYRQEGMQLNDFCDRAAKLQIDAILKNKSLDAWLAACPQSSR